MEQKEFLQTVQQQITAAAEELITVAQPKPGQIFVVGCSTSEVLGEKIGTAGSPETAQVMMVALLAVTHKHHLYLAQQCCEHLNRALVVEEEVLDKYNLTQVTVHPVPHAGGSMASAAYETFKHPVVVEQIQAHLGLDIGQTLIGMHLKRVAVPVRLSVKKIGNAVLTAARTRPPLIGGERAKYF
ncbi:MAG: TIGR01440 family protein [Acidaminococcaceae bacterium]|jgi:uncharacterized protein (TIGR01440 family)|nr:TIGR01440 family protein [Acidaminococcaceae bacterium]